MQGLVTLRPLASSSASKAAGSRSINSRSPASMAMVKTEGTTTTTGEERARTTTPVSRRRLRLVSKKNNNNMAAAAALFRSSPMLQACAVPAAAARTATDVSAAAEVVVGAAEKKKGNAKIFKSRLQLDTVEDGHCSSSSGSEHEPSSVCLAAMVHEFLEQHEGENKKCGHSRCNCEAAGGSAACSCDGRSAANDSEDGKSSSLGGGQILGSLQGLTACTKDSEKNLLSEVTEALNAAAVKERSRGAEQEQENQQQHDQEEAPDSSSSRRRVIMKHLRAAGYNAAICKSRWDHAGGFPGGDYEYIDVVFSVASSTSSSSSNKIERVLIDIDFKTQFEIARPTKEYNAIVKALPIAFVGGEDRLQQIVNLMSDAVKSSLKKRGMPLPPWRKPEYMHAKWLSSYKRSTNQSSRSGKDLRTSSSDISRIAIRDRGWDSKYTKMQIEYQKPEARQLSMMKEIQKGAAAAVDDVVYLKTRTNLIINAAAVSSSQAGSSNKSLIEAAAIENMEWELPAVEAKVSRRRPAALTGLAAILKEAGLPAANTQQPKDEGEERQHQQIMLRSRSLAMAM